MTARPLTPEEELLRRRRARQGTAEYISYVSHRDVPDHAKYISAKFDKLDSGDIDRLLVCVPPGHMKSWISQHFISRFMSRHPGSAVIHASHTQKLVAQWGGIIRNRLGSLEHRMLYPEDGLDPDVSARDEWATTSGSTYIAAGVDTAIQGRRAALAVIDDPIPKMSAAESATVRDNLWQWYGGDLQSRLLPDAKVVLIQTRFHLDDLAGRLLQAARDNVGEPWETCILPAQALENDPLGREPEEWLWPYYAARLERLKRQSFMTRRLWSSLYQQSPTVDSGGIIDRSWFKLWRSIEPPKIKFVLQSWDTALTANKESAYSACTTWGVFDEPIAREEKGIVLEQREDIPAVILLSAFRKRMEWPELRRMAQRLAVDYRDDGNIPIRPDGKHRPDTVLVEAKANSRAMLLDLMHAGVSVMGFNPDKYGDKVARVRLITDLIENGRVYLPGEPPGFTRPRRWAEEFQDQCAAFPADASRDYVDTMTQAFLRIKASGWVMNTENATFGEEGRRATGGERQAIY